jgi:hypothetical protein
MDPVTGLIVFQHRDYNTGTGMWLEQDPAGYVDGADAYAALTDDPAGQTDYGGLKASGASGSSATTFGSVTIQKWVQPNVPAGQKPREASDEELAKAVEYYKWLRQPTIKDSNGNAVPNPIAKEIEQLEKGKHKITIICGSSTLTTPSDEDKSRNGEGCDVTIYYNPLHPPQHFQGEDKDWKSDPRSRLCLKTVI